jgi:hypothetical protein
MVYLKLVLIGVILSLGAQVWADESLSFQDTSIQTRILPEPVPFTVDAQAAQIAINLMRSAMFLLHQPPGQPRRIIQVRQVWAEFQFADQTFPPGFRRRFDLLVNQEPLDWAHTFIEYGGQMISMKVLFTYRNQDPGLGYEFLLGGW